MDTEYKITIEKQNSTYNGSSYFTNMRKNLGTRENIADNQIKEIVDIYLNNKEGENCKIFDNSFFGYTKITIEQPLKKGGQIVKDKEQ